ncbi:MAG: hypothetical protein QGG64_08570 [Candidatus Latescibacteria bacterium]|nr:hypothetical protein [Candidatus Latescibacterota bacterium]
MATLALKLDGSESALSAQQRNEDILVPLDAFCDLIGAEAKEVDGGMLAVCRDDLCIPLNVSSDQDTMTVDDVLFGRLEAFGEPLGLAWNVADGVLSVRAGNGVAKGLGIGQTPPDFTLSDLYTEEPVSLRDYRGKKTAFYMWASW